MPAPRETSPIQAPTGASRLRVLLLVVAAFSWAAPGAQAQSVLVDQGAFLLSRGGRPVGTESFTIRRSGTGPDVEFVATSNATLNSDSGQRRISSALEARGPEMRITAYQVKEAGKGQGEVYMTLSDNRYQATIRTPGSEQLREFRASPSSIVLEDGLAYEYFVLPSRVGGASARVPAILPRAGKEVLLQVTDTGSERVSIGGKTISARHLVVDGGGDTRDLWVDGRGRVLRLVGRTSGLRIERRDPPD